MSSTITLYHVMNPANLDALIESGRFEPSTESELKGRLLKPVTWLTTDPNLVNLPPHCTTVLELEVSVDEACRFGDAVDAGVIDKTAHWSRNATAPSCWDIDDNWYLWHSSIQNWHSIKVRRLEDFCN